MQNENMARTAIEETAEKLIQIQTFGGLSMQINGNCMGLHEWKSRRLYQLLAMLVACGGQGVPQGKIIDLLWPDADGDKAVQNFEFNLRQLRKLLADKLEDIVHGSELISWQQGKINLNERYFSLDIWRWESLIREAETLRDQRRDAEAFVMEKQACRLMRGVFFSGEEEIFLSQQQYWQQRGGHWLTLTAMRWRECKHTTPTSLMWLTEIALKFDPDSENLCLQAMLTQLEEGFAVDALRTYFCWTERIKGRYSIKPSSKVVQLVSQIQRAQAVNGNFNQVASGL
ncbi:MAG: BTAD domain-containing putative transcriptional regulator [Sideroxydans sp.]|nr:BTAD domain-containing putative transcriptional regulator [Sideroxydans sp.]